MEITFLGGAEEIGASCAILDLEGFRLLIDGGQRLGASPGQVFPDFSHLEKGPPVSAVLLTHAHADHIGSLPALESILPAECPIYATEPTFAISKVMLEDTIRIIQQHRQGDGELPMFASASVKGALGRFQTVRWGKAIHPAGTSLWATWFPAGHILGAAMIEIRGANESVLFSGDISVTDQLSVPGVFVPAIRPTVLVLESTYGNRLHAHRPAQEQRIVERVAAAHAAGGSVLFPTFAVGRAQEILLILGRAMRDGSMPRIPVYADGLVRAVSKVYARFADDLAPACRQLWEHGLDPIFPEDLPIRPVKNNDERESVAVGEPCVVVSSSGMLQGGASQFYARHWVGDERNLILVTGYQDEESPGQALLNLVAQPSDQPRYFKLGGVRTEIRCHIESCQLSAHADTGELVSVAAKLKPTLILPVHGDGGAREGLARGLAATSKARVLLPMNGETYAISPEGTALGGRGQSPSRVNPLSLWPPWDPLQPRELDLARFHGWLANQTPRIAWVTLEELAEIWRSPGSASSEDWDRLRAAVYEEAQPYFLPDAKRPYLLKLTPPENLADIPVGEAKLTVEYSAKIVRAIFPPESGLERFGFFPEEGIVRLDFRFPKAARRHYGRRLGELRERTGWHAELNEHTSEENLLGVVRESPLGTSLAGFEVRPDQELFRVLLPDAVGGEDLDDFKERFLRKTGFRLQIEFAPGKEIQTGS